jgi:hypothetical protein
MHFNVCTPVPWEWSSLTNILYIFSLLPHTLCPNHLYLCDLMMLFRTDDMLKFEVSLYVVRVLTLNSKLYSPVKQYYDSRNLHEFARPFPWFDLRMVTPWHGYVGREDRQRYSSNPFAILEGDEWSAPCSVWNNPGKDLLPIVLEAEWISGLVWTEWKSSPLPGLDPQTVQPIVKCYTNCPISAGDTASFCWNHMGYLSTLVIQMPSQIFI